MRYDINGYLITNIANKFREYITNKEPADSNLIKSSIDTDFSIYNNGTGWKHGYRLGSNGVEKVDDYSIPQSVTGYIKASYGDVFTFTNITTSLGYQQYIFCYDSNFNKISSAIPVYNDTIFVSVTITDSSCEYIRVSAQFDETAIIEKQNVNTEEDVNTYKLTEMPNAIDAVYEKGVEDGKASVDINLQSKSITPTASSTTVTSDNGYDGLSSVVISGDSDLVASNIKKGIEIFGVTGTYEETGGITPSGSLNITENGTFDVTNYASAIVNVASSGGGGSSDVATGEVTATSKTTLTVDTGKTDATHFLLYIDDSSLSSSTVIMFLIMPLTSFGFRYSGSEKKVAMFSSLGTTYTTTGSISNGVATCNMGNTYSFTARTYKWIAW